MNFRKLMAPFKLNTLKPAESANEGVQFIFGDLNEDIAHEMANSFADVPPVTVVHGNLLDLPCQAIMSPANSFGDMGGGIDKAIDDFHKGHAQPKVREAIMNRHFGELPIGSAQVVHVANGDLGTLIVAPTMRIPGKITDSINVYLSFRAALIALIKHNEMSEFPIQSLAVPGLGTGVGGMGYADAAQQMRTAYHSILQGGWQEVMHPAMAPYVMRSLA